MSQQITKEQYNNVINAGHALCDYCEAYECDNCIVVRLINDATNEAIHAGIIRDDMNPDDNTNAD